jgi:hypothetical protein
MKPWVYPSMRKTFHEELVSLLCIGACDKSQMKLLGPSLSTS